MAKTIIRTRKGSDPVARLARARLRDGVNVVQSFTVDGRKLRLAAVVRGNKITGWQVLAQNGRQVPVESIKVSAKGKVTCWRCVKDRSGDLHCFMIPCPDIPLPPFGTAAFAATLRKIQL